MAVTLTVGSNTWISLSDAETYFEARVHSTAWSDEDDGGKKAALVSAYRDLTGGDMFSFPDSISDGMKYAQCEQALFRLSDDGIDARAGLRAQGVERAGVVQEAYAGGIEGVPISPAARGHLAAEGIYAEGSSTSATQHTLYRDEDD